MATEAFKTQYREQYVSGFEQKISMFRQAATGSYVEERVISGNTATFLVADTGGASAVTRGNNGFIPARSDNLSQPVATLVEWHDKPRRTKFNIFASQGNGVQILQDGSIKVLNRKIDDIIITELSTATNNSGTSATASLRMFANAQAALGVADVDIDEEDKMFCAISHAARKWLMQIPEFTRADYVDVKYFDGPAIRMKRWMGINFFVSNRLSGKGTATEKLLMWHRDAIGFADDRAGMDVTAGFNDEEAYYYARASMHMGAKLLQNSGVYIINHDGTA